MALRILFVSLILCLSVWTNLTESSLTTSAAPTTTVTEECLSPEMFNNRMEELLEKVCSVEALLDELINPPSGGKSKGKGKGIGKGKGKGKGKGQTSTTSSPQPTTSAPQSTTSTPQPTTSTPQPTTSTPQPTTSTTQSSSTLSTTRGQIPQ